MFFVGFLYKLVKQSDVHGEIRTDFEAITSIASMEQLYPIEYLYY